MLHAQFDLKRINKLKEIIINLREGESIQAEMKNFTKNISDVELFLIEQELLSEAYGITIADLMNLHDIYPHLYEVKIDQATLEAIHDHAHPVSIFKQENKQLQARLKQIRYLLEAYAKDPDAFIQTDMLEVLKEQVIRLGEIHNHFNRKEKILFPILERSGHVAPTRMMWRKDDRIRGLYQGLKRLISELPAVNFSHVKKTYDVFKQACNEMIFEEEALILPVMILLFTEKEWTQVATESDAFGYAFLAPKQKGQESRVEADARVKRESGHEAGNISFGGGLLTIEEADLILNHLPLEITFVDKHSVFKYFNETKKAEDMMLIRTPISIGRNVANCHPPKSLKKVMTLVRDLKTKKRTVESMWYKKDDTYIHLTYKALFNETGEYMGILEYVQDIQPFFELPSELKTGLSKCDG